MGRVHNGDTTREPCPDRILWDAGGSFAMGAVGSTIIAGTGGLLKGVRGRRMATGLEYIRMHAPRYGGSFAVWGGLFSLSDCTSVYLRQKEDPWNSVIAGAATGAILATRRGPKHMMIHGAIGGVFLAMIEGALSAVNKYEQWQRDLAMQGMPGPQVPDPIERPQQQQQPQGSSGEVSSGGWGLGGLFGWGKKHQVVNGGGTEMLESFDTPSPPVRYQYE